MDESRLFSSHFLHQQNLTENGKINFFIKCKFVGQDYLSWLSLVKFYYFLPLRNPNHTLPEPQINKI
jgi:hypothetical protein